MQHMHLRFGDGLKVILGDEHSHAVQMAHVSGGTEGMLDNRHNGMDHRLFLAPGEGRAIIMREESHQFSERLRGARRRIRRR